MRKVLGSLGALAFLSLVPAQAQASTASWLGISVCTTGSLAVCLSVQDLKWDASTNRLTFTIVNLSPGMEMTHTITRLGFYHDANGVQWTGTATVVSAPTGWTLDANAISTNGSGFELELGVGTNGIQDGIGPDGSATFVIELSSEFLFDASAQMRWHSQNVGPTGESIKCDTGWSDADPDGSYPPCLVIPEPVTIVLLGTGLAGLGGAALRRRRKNGDIVSG